MKHRVFFQFIGLSGLFLLAACGRTGTPSDELVITAPPTAALQIPMAEPDPVATVVEVEDQDDPGQAPAGPVQTGQASWMHRNLNGRLTANGERHSIRAITAAHRTLPFNTYVRVTSVETGQSIVVRINDRGPYVRGRIIDLSEAAAKRIGLHHAGVGRVTVEPVSSPGQS